MNGRLRYLLHILDSSLWVIPTLGVLLAVLLSRLVVIVDHSGVGDWIERTLGIYAIGAEGARTILSTVAGSMMTIASLVFSITLLTLTVASQQLGPRLLEWFMRDRANQVVMGCFISLFTFALLTIGAIDEGETGYVPYSSVVVAMAATVANLIVLVVYVHRAASSIQADTIVARAAASLDRALAEHLLVDAAEVPAVAVPAAPAPGTVITAASDGYVQNIDEATLVAIARRHSGVLRLRCEPGHFLFDGSPIGEFGGAPPSEGLADEVRAAVLLGPKRTAVQDVEFDLHGLVEIALRALSPGINDPFTAMICIDRLAAALARVTRGTIRPEVCLDADGVARLVVPRPRIDGLMEAAFGAIRTHAAGDEIVLRRLVEALASLAGFVGSLEPRQAIERQIAATRRVVEASIDDDRLKAKLLADLAHAEARLNGAAAAAR